MRRASIAATLLLVACRPEAPAPVPLPADSRDVDAGVGPAVDTLAAEIPAGTTALHGSVVLMVEDDQVHVAAALDGAAPGAGYRVEIRERGDCAAPGSVFTLPGAAERSAADATGAADVRQAIGDFGAFAADGAGQARFSSSKQSPVGAAAFAGRSVVVRRDAGGVAGCGVLRPVAR